MTLEEIFDAHKRGSNAFTIAVEQHCGFDISRMEIVRLSNEAWNAEQFQAMYDNDDWWTDKINDRAF